MTNEWKSQIPLFRGEEMELLIPCYKCFKGTIHVVGSGIFLACGKIKNSTKMKLKFTHCQSAQQSNNFKKK